MKKGLIKAGVLVVVFFAALIGFSLMTNQTNKDLTTDMANATLPMIDLYTGTQKINELHGYTVQMDASYMRDTITPVGTDMKVPATIQTFGTDVDAISYKIRSMDGKDLIAEAAITDYTENGGLISMQIPIQNLIKEGQEYNLILELKHKDKTYYYYTRILKSEDANVEPCVEFAQNFHEMTFDEEKSGGLSTYMEPDASADNSTLNRVTINSTLSQVTWNQFKGVPLSEPAVAVREIQGSYNVVTLSYVMTSTGDNGELEYYNVEEYYRIRYTASRIYLLNFERTMNQIFRGENDSFYDNCIQLGIRSGDIAYQSNENGSVVCFVQEGELWSYDENNDRLYQVFFMCVLSALIGQCYAGSMVTLYVFYELMTLLSVPMVVHERTPQAVAAGIKYLVYSIFGAMLGLLGIFFFSNYLGTVTFAPGGVETAASAPSGLLLITFLVIIGFGTKAGMFPMHGWLPTAHPVAPAPASAVLSGVITKAGVLAVLRVIYYLVGADVLRGTWVQKGFMTLTLITVFMGSMLAYREPLIKKRLAYSTVSQVSYVLFGLACMVPTAFEGAMLHVVAHSVIKDALFLCAGAFIHQTGKTYVRELRGIGKEMPITTWCWTIASLGLIGIPPTGGFVSKWELATGSLQTGLAGFDVIGPVILIVSALLTAAYLLPVTINGFFPGSDYDYAGLTNKEGGKLMTVPMILLAVGVVVTGVFAQPLIHAVAVAAASVL